MNTKSKYLFSLSGKNMKDLMSHNIYEHKDTLIICGSCLPNMDPTAFEKLKKISDQIYFVCLEEIHINMVAHKIASILRTDQLKKIIFASVDGSPHCVQLHYIKTELEKIMELKNTELKNYVSNSGDLVQIIDEEISLSRKLSKLKEAIKKI